MPRPECTRADSETLASQATDKRSTESDTLNGSAAFKPTTRAALESHVAWLEEQADQIVAAREQVEDSLCDAPDVTTTAMAYESLDSAHHRFARAIEEGFDAVVRTVEAEDRKAWPVTDGTVGAEGSSDLSTSGVGGLGARRREALVKIDNEARQTTGCRLKLKW